MDNLNKDRIYSSVVDGWMHTTYYRYSEVRQSWVRENLYSIKDVSEQDIYKVVGLLEFSDIETYRDKLNMYRLIREFRK